MLRVPSIEALIISLDTRAALRETLSSLREHRPPANVADLRISVLDNASCDGSAEMVASQFPDVRLVRSDLNLGFGRATNRLARDSTADYLLLLNSDVVLTEDVITPLLRSLEAHSCAIVAGPRLVYPDGLVQYSAQRLPTLSYEFARVLCGRRLDRILRPVFDSRQFADTIHEVVLTRQRTEPRTPEFLWATCWLIRRADVVADGLFDDAFLMYDEDLDFCRRARERGRTLRYVSSAELVHLGSMSSPTSTVKRNLTRQARLRYYLRHHGPFAAFAYAVGVPAVEALASLLEAIPRPRLPSTDRPRVR